MQRGIGGTRLSRTCLCTILAMAIAACGGDDDGGDTAASSAPPPGSAPPPPSAPPSIAGTPPKAVAVGERYAFTPSASDPEGDRLTFSIAQKPGWLKFNTAKGTLIGTPSAADVGTYRGIAVTVSDGRNTTALPLFDIDVPSVGSRVATLDWHPPTENEDGSPLLDLAGYELAYGRQSGLYTHRIDVPNPGITTYVVTGLTPGAYYFAMVAYNEMDVRSRLSGELAIQVQ